MKKIIYITFAVLFFSCGDEPNEKKGKIVNDPDELNDKDFSNQITEDTATEYIAPEEKILKLKGGIIIEYLKKGEGDILKKGEMVSVTYKTRLPDGKVIDGSDLIGKPLQYYIGINMSIKGWDDAFLYLKVGDKIKLHLPAEKAYGKKGYGTMVPPDTDLDFDIEIVSKVQPLTTASGLKYYYLVKNDGGKKAEAGKKVDMHYYAWIYDESKIFDSSHFNGKTYRFTVGDGEEILAWEEIIQLMRENEKVLMYVPSKLGFAEKGIPELVPPNADLVYLIELMNVL